MEQARCIVNLAVDGEEAVQKVREDTYEAILMDLQMPKIDGYDATRNIRVDPRFKARPIIAMTAHAMSDVKEKCLAAGMNDYVTKPIEFDELFSILQSLIKQSTNDSMVGSGKKIDESNMKDEAIIDLPGIDWKQSLKNVAGNKTLLQQLIFKFYQDFSNIQPRLRRCTIKLERNLEQMNAGNDDLLDEFFSALAQILQGLEKLPNAAPSVCARSNR